MPALPGLGSLWRMASGLCLAGVGGFEPPTTGFGDQRSVQAELHPSGKCAPGRNRTPDALLRTEALYPLSYRGPYWWR